MATSTFSSTLQDFDSNLWGCHIPIPAEQAKPFIKGSDRRVICKINGAARIQSALMPLKGDYFILINKKIRQQLQLSLGDSIEVSLEKDHSEYGMDMPESFQALLAQDEESSPLFHALTPGKQRSLIHIITRVKGLDSQISKGLAILDHLKEQQGKLDFKLLQAKIKAYNQRNKLR